MSRQGPSNEVLQLPSWDDYDLEYEDDPPTDDPVHLDPSPSSPNNIEEPSSASNDVSSPLPRVDEVGQSGANLGPSLPAGFLISDSRVHHPEDPEGPSDQRRLLMHNEEHALPQISDPVIRFTGVSDSREESSTTPRFYGAPSLPDDELRGDFQHSMDVSSHLPPPEPGHVRSKENSPAKDLQIPEFALPEEPVLEDPENVPTLNGNNGRIERREVNLEEPIPGPSLPSGADLATYQPRHVSTEQQNDERISHGPSYPFEVPDVDEEERIPQSQRPRHGLPLRQKRVAQPSGTALEFKRQKVNGFPPRTVNISEPCSSSSQSSTQDTRPTNGMLNGQQSSREFDEVICPQPGCSRSTTQLNGHNDSGSSASKTNGRKE